MNKLTIKLALALTPLVASASAGTLQSCDFITTPQGAAYVGTYCVDFSCQYVVRRVFQGYCPYTLPR